MKPTYRSWLEGQKYDSSTVNAQMYRAARVEECHGNLDQHFADDQMASLISALRYSTDDQRRGRPNPSKIPFEGDIKNNLASYRNAVERYRRFCLTGDDSDDPHVPAAVEVGEVAEDIGQRIGLERDMQSALRRVIGQLEPELTIIDDGVERSVESGFIDITALDAIGVIVVIELKAGVAGQRAVAKILSYMGDIAAEEEAKKVRGILVAAEFDAKAKSAARMVPDLVLRRYSVKFEFSDA
jgi:hypothetical protein